MSYHSNSFWDCSSLCWAIFKVSMSLSCFPFAVWKSFVTADAKSQQMRKREKKHEVKFVCLALGKSKSCCVALKSDFFILGVSRSVGRSNEMRFYQWDIYEVPNLEQVLTICRPLSLLKGGTKCHLLYLKIKSRFKPNYSHKTGFSFSTF